MRAILLLVAGAGLLGAENLRMTTQVIEVPHATLTEWTSGPALSGGEMHRAAMERVREGEARVVDTTVLTGRSGERFGSESIAEMIYPTDADYGSMPISLPAGKLGEATLSGFPRWFRYSPTAFETRHTGATLELSPMAGEGLVELGVSLEMVRFDSFTQWGIFRDTFGDASNRFPRFGQQSLHFAATLAAGHFEWIGTLSPEPLAVPAMEKRCLVFMRVEILRMEGTE